MATYDATVTRIRDWANRDADVLSSENIKIFLQFAADEAYRLLRVPALELLREYNITSTGSKLAIPTDLTEFIQLRKVDDISLTGFTPYQAKADIQSFYSERTAVYDYYVWTRERNDIVIYPDFIDGETYQLYYYGRQDALNVRYEVNADNDEADNLYFGVDQTALETAVMDAESANVFLTDPTLRDDIVTIPSDTPDDDPDIADGLYLGMLTNNWLRDENEKIILFGALMEAFDFLDEQEQSGKYREKFFKEIQALNTEEMNRKARGGNVQVHYIAPLI